MIRVLRLNTWDRFNWFKTLWRHQFDHVFRHYGIEFVDESPDLVLTCNFPPGKEFNDLPAVVEINRDATSMPQEHLDWVAPGNVIACFRNAVYRYPELYRRPMVLGDYYGYVWAKETYNELTVQIENPPPLPSRVESMLTLALPPYLPPQDVAFQRTAEFLPLIDRSYDVGFAGRRFYDDRWPQEHRTHLWQVFDSLPGNNCWAGYWFKQEAWDYAAYFDWMRRCKIIIAPWGYAAWTARDYEAMLAGCVVVKPECSGILAYPDLYDPWNQMCVSCRVDFADLGDVVQRILDDLPRYQKRAEEARQVVRKQMAASNLVRIWCQKLREAYRRR